MSRKAARSLAPPLDRWARSFVTPEGVDLRLRVASMGQRATAFLIDALIISSVMLALTLLCVLATYGAASAGIAPVEANRLTGSAAAVIWLLGFFLLRNFYFLYFELGPRAATPGKRAGKLRVATRDGGALTTGAVFTRNAMREIEVFLPLGFIFAEANGVDGTLALLGLIWTGGFVLFPLFNRDRLRVGDLLAGTWVVMAPRRGLAADMARAPAEANPRFAFTTAQLDVYGVKELQVLEQLLRGPNSAAIRGVAERIRGKIGWTAAPQESDYDFLDAYYVALRRRLEQLMLLGRRRKDKHDLT